MKTHSLVIVATIAAIAGGVFYWYKNGPGKASSNDRDNSEYPASAEINGEDKPAANVSAKVRELPKVPPQTGGGYPITPAIETDYNFDQETQKREGVYPIQEDFPRIAVK